MRRDGGNNDDIIENASDVDCSDQELRQSFADLELEKKLKKCE